MIRLLLVNREARGKSNCTGEVFTTKNQVTQNYTRGLKASLSERCGFVGEIHKEVSPFIISLFLDTRVFPSFNSIRISSFSSSCRVKCFKPTAKFTFHFNSHLACENALRFYTWKMANVNKRKRWNENSFVCNPFSLKLLFLLLLLLFPLIFFLISSS